MSFTDEDLKRMKNGMSTLRMAMEVSEYSLGADELEALLARLEAAEAMQTGLLNGEHISFQDAKEAWLKSAGRDTPKEGR